MSSARRGPEQSLSRLAGTDRQAIGSACPGELLDGFGRLRHSYQAMAGRDSGAPLELVDDLGRRHLLQGRFVHDGALVEALTCDGWVSGHYRSSAEPKSRTVAFEMELLSRANQRERITVYLPGATLFRWPARDQTH